MTSIEAVVKKLQSLKDRFEKLEKDVRGLKDLLNVHNNWHSTIREWTGERIRVCDRASQVYDGKLLWSDRYNLCIEIPKGTKGSFTDPGGPRVYTKGGINWIERA